MLEGHARKIVPRCKESPSNVVSAGPKGAENERSYITKNDPTV